jgi:Domain of unknown function (DUF4178)
MTHRYQPGSTVTVDDVTWTVRGRIDVTADDHLWSEYFLTDGGAPAWGVMEDVDGEARWSFWERRRAAEARFNPHHEAQDCALVEIDRGHAHFRLHGEAGDLDIPASGTVSYMEFTRPGQRLSMERFHPAGAWWLDTCDAR